MRRVIGICALASKQQNNRHDRRKRNNIRR